jgi:predicted lipid-binding transport protein (Tim44 family)
LLFLKEHMFLVILILVTFFIFYRLFREFGKTQEIVINVFATNKLAKSALKKASEKTTLPKTIVKHGTLKEEELSKNIASIQNKIPNFTVSTFLSKAEEMFDTIFGAFVDSNYQLLKSMLTERLYTKFSEQISKREKNNLKQEIQINHKKTTLDKIQIFTKKTKLFVSFDVEQMIAMVNLNGISLDNPKKLYRQVLHKWIFEKEFDKGDWILSKTYSTEQ